MLMPCWNLAERSVKSSFRIVRFRFQLTVGRFFRVDRSLSVNVSNDFSLPFMKVSDHSSSFYEASRLSFSAWRKALQSSFKTSSNETFSRNTIIIHWTTEFGRMPSTQGRKGRGHNPYIFTNWLVGGGHHPRGGRATNGDTTPRPEAPHPSQRRVRHNSIDRRLTDVHGHIIGVLLS